MLNMEKTKFIDEATFSGASNCTLIIIWFSTLKYEVLLSGHSKDELPGKE